MIKVVWQTYADSSPTGPLRTAAVSDADSEDGLDFHFSEELSPGGRVIDLHVEVKASPTHPMAYGLEWTFPQPKGGLYTLLPACLYAGNRFEAVKVPYSPRYPADRTGPQMPLLLSDVPRLELDTRQASQVHVRAGDLSWPAFACWHPETGEARLIYGKSHTAWGETLWELYEPEGHSEISLRVMAPGVRPVRYVHMRSDAASADTGHAASPGHRDHMRMVSVEWTAPDLPAFFGTVFAHWHAALEGASIPPTVPLSEAYALIAEKYERENWHADWRLYMTVTDRANRYPYQTGWCGGGIAAYALLDWTDPQVRAHARSNIDTVCAEALTAAGLLFGKRASAGWIPDFHGQTEHPHTVEWTLSRRQGDALFYLAKAIFAEQAITGTSLPADHPWRVTLRTLADGLSRVWEKEGQWGHFLNNHDGSVTVGGTCSGAIIPAGLVLAAELEKQARWVDIAVAGATAFRDEWTNRGLTAGGPGDALGNIDSESGAALVESYTWLWQVTGDPRWLTTAVSAAHQLATWVMPYAYPFPKDSEFGRLGLFSTGTVFANTQNKHSAPGICTHSGEALLRLYRATGDERLLDLLRVIVRTLPQYVSRSDRPIHDPTGRPLPPGWINERVNTSDWDNNLGGVFHGSCWCEVSLLLSWMELPGVYGETDSGRLVALDHVEAEWGDPARTHLRLHNPTRHRARVRLLVETAEARKAPLPADSARKMPVVEVPAGDTILHPLA